MALQIGDTAPDFEAETTEGRIRFHDWIGDSWAVLFSHPRDFTPVCTTELGYMAKIKPEFERRNVKVIGLSVDPVDNHAKWAHDIEETQGQAPNYPMIGDADFNVSKLYGMLPAETAGDPTKRTPADNQTVRNVFVVGPDKKIKLILVYPMTTGRNFDEVLCASCRSRADRVGDHSLRTDLEAVVASTRALVGAFACRLIDEDRHTVADHFRVDQPQRLLVARAVEEAFAGAEDDREDHQAQLVDEVVLDEGLHEPRAAVDDDVAVSFLPQLPDLLHDVALQHGRVVPVGVLERG